MNFAGRFKGDLSALNCDMAIIAKIRTVILLLLVICCDITRGMGLCKFKRMFPNSNNKDKPAPNIPVNHSDPSCPPNMIHAQCTCNGTCDAPTKCFCNATESTKCVCPDGFFMHRDECVQQEQCGCFREGDGVISAFEIKMNFDCSEQCTCLDNQLTCNRTNKCSRHSTCMVREGVRKCYCNDGFVDNGETCALYKDCYDALRAGQKTDGIYAILPLNWPGLPFNVLCDMKTNGGGWTVFQRRIDGVTDFYRNWQSYKTGFGVLDGDFWMGNDKLYFLTNQRSYQLRIDVTSSKNVSKFVEYSSFRIGNETNKYRLHAKKTSARNQDDKGISYNDGGLFSTPDRDYDGCPKYDCGKIHRGAWWYTNKWCHAALCGHNCFAVNVASDACSKTHTKAHTFCTNTNLNGDYNYGNGGNIYYRDLGGCHLNFTEMKIRPLI